MTERELIQAVSEELGNVLGALLDASCSVTSGASVSKSRWNVELVFIGPSAGTLTIGFDDEGAGTLARLVMALDDTPPDAAIADTLQEVCGQALSAVSQRDGFAGLRLVEARINTASPAGSPSGTTLAAEDKLTTSVAFWSTLETPKPAAAPSVSHVPAVIPPSPVAAAPPNLELILDIDLPLTVRFGETQMTLDALTQLAPGSMIDLDRSPDDPVDVLVNGRLVARGEVVVVSGNYGVRITEVISAADRLRTVAA